MEQRLGKFLVEILDGAGDADRCGQSVVLTIGDFLWNNIHAESVVFDVAHGEQDSAMPQKRRKFFEHGNESSGMEMELRISKCCYFKGRMVLRLVAHWGNGSNR
jgi:hypothetical protein